MLSEKFIEQLREELKENLQKNYKKLKNKHIKLNIQPELLEKLIFKSAGYRCKKLAISIELLKMLDLTGVSWDCVDIQEIDFSNTKGVKINPQEVFLKSLSNTKLCDVKIIGKFDYVYISGTDFTGSKGAKIDPQKVFFRNLQGTKLCDAKIIGKFDAVDISGTDFTGSKGAIVQLDNVRGYDEDTNFTDAEVTTNEYQEAHDNIMNAFSKRKVFKKTI